jgi:hypothetical protein
MEHTVFKQILSAQDEHIRALGVDVWVGMEPTFTRRFAETPEWLSEALGPAKLSYAYRLLTEVCQRQPGGIVSHTLGRQYAGEDKPSFVLTHRNLEEALEMTYHEWQPQALPYSGLPADMEEATRCRNERITTRVIPASEYSQPTNPPDTAIDDYCLDLRRLMSDPVVCD